VLAVIVFKPAPFGPKVLWYIFTIFWIMNSIANINHARDCTYIDDNKDYKSPKPKLGLTYLAHSFY
jgi:hypothetical protein